MAQLILRLADGNQRPNILCDTHKLGSGISYHQAAANGLSQTGNSSVFNNACFAYPGDEIPGNASRYIATLRTDGIHDMDLSFSKEMTAGRQPRRIHSSGR